MSSEVEAELERRLKAQYEPAKVEKRSYSPAPSSTPSLHPTEKALRDAAWQWLRKNAPAGALIVVLGGAGSFGGRKAQDAARDAADEAHQVEMAKLRRDLRDALAELDDQAEELRKARRDLTTTAGAHETLAAEFRKLQAQVNTLEAAKALLIKADPDRPPRP